MKEIRMIRRETYSTEMAARRIAERVLNKMYEESDFYKSQLNFIEKEIDRLDLGFLTVTFNVFEREFGPLANKVLRRFVDWNDDANFAHYVYQYIKENHLFDGLDIVNDDNWAANTAKGHHILREILGEKGRDKFTEWLLDYLEKN